MARSVWERANVCTESASAHRVTLFSTTSVRPMKKVGSIKYHYLILFSLKFFINITSSISVNRIRDRNEEREQQKSKLSSVSITFPASSIVPASTTTTTSTTLTTTTTTSITASPATRQRTRSTREPQPLPTIPRLPSTTANPETDVTEDNSIFPEPTAQPSTTRSAITSGF